MVLVRAVPRPTRDYLRVRDRLSAQTGTRNTYLWTPVFDRVEEGQVSSRAGQYDE